MRILTCRRFHWHLGIVFSLGISGTLAGVHERSLAQSNIVPDNTLGNENSLVVPNFEGLPVEVIEGGALRGQNLFHSFRAFNVSQDRGAYFFSPSSEIQNILARVTGINPSRILGTLGTFGNSQPNLFLINPNGIIFGENASLDVGGSFVATTANAIRLGDTGLFSASEPQRSNLLEINPSAFFFNALANQAQIVNRSTATTTVLDAPTSGLMVADGESLLLVGGEVKLEGGRIFALGGRVELGGVAGTGTVGLNGNGSNLSLSFPDGVARADVSLTNEAEVNVRAGDGGSIAINARNVNVLQGSKVRAGIASGLGSSQSEAGDIEINATEIMTVAGELSFLANVVLPEGVGKAGDINITTGSLFVKEGGYLNSSLQGQGDSGNLTINARDTVSFDGIDPNGGSSRAVSTVLEGAVGNGGNINITTGSFFVTNGAQLIVGTAGQGDAGNVKISATDTVRFDGVSSNGFPSAAFNDVEARAVGNGGDIEINTGSLEVTNGAILFADTAGQGDAGSVRIRATDIVRFDGGNASIKVDVGAVGDGGDIEINTSSLEVINGAQLFASTFGQGNASSVKIVASDTVSFDGVGSNGISSAAISSVGTGAVGDGGNIEITTGSLEVSNGAFLFASTSGQGNAGSVRIRASDTVSFDGVSSDGLPSTASSSVLSGGVGDGGDIEINTGSLRVINGAQLFAGTAGQGSAGSVRITASDTVSFDGVSSDGLPSTASSSVSEGGVGDGGDIEINTGSLEVTNGADLSAATFGQGNSGSVRITATDTVRFDGGEASSAVVIGAVGDGSDLEITTGTLEVTNGAVLSAGTFGQGNSGSVRISATETVRLDGGITASDVGPGAVGDGGDIEITTGTLEVTNGALLFAATAGRGNAGSVRITATDTVRFDGSDAASAVVIGAVGDGGDIEVTTGTLEVTNEAFLSADTGGKGNAGNVRITATDTVRFDGSSALSAVAEGGVGDGGDIEINTGSLEVTNGAFLIGGTIGQGNAGAVRINATDAVNFDGGGASSFVGPTGVGDGGDIEITTGSLSLTDAFISSESRGTGTAGDITLETRQNLEINRSSILATTQAGNGGNIRLRIGDLLLMRNDSNISTTAGVAGSGGDGGNININAGFVVAVPREDSDITANAFNGRGGNINITTQGIYGLEFRERDIPASSDITASSQLGLDGEFQLDLLSAVDPSRGLVQLPTNVVDASEQIDRRCTPSGTVGEGSSFSVTGRGGLPASPNETLQGESTVVNWVSLESEAEHNTSSGITKLSNAAQGQHVEAQGWMRDEKGQVVLTAQAPEITPNSGWLDEAKCQVFQRPETPPL